MKTTVVTLDKLPKNLVWDYNCRAPSKSSRAYKVMREQLRTAPDAFVELNSGVVIANEKYILDGGHTILALLDAVKEQDIEPNKVRVRVTWMDGLSSEEMTARSVGLNTKVTPPLRGEKDIQGHWDSLKNNLDSSLKGLFEFKPHTAPGAPYTVEFLVALVHGWSGHSPERSYAGKGVLVRLYTPEKYSRLMPFLGLAIDWWSFLYGEVFKDTKVKTWDGVRKDRDITLPNGQTHKGVLPEAYVWPVFAAFHQVIVRAQKEDWTVEQTRQDMQKRWTGKKKKMLAALAADYRDNGSSPTRMGKAGETYTHQLVALLGE